MHWSSDSSSVTSTTWPTPECRATITAKAAASAVTSSVRAMGGSSGPPSASPLMAANPDMASASVANPGRCAYGPSCPNAVTRHTTSRGFRPSSTSGPSPSRSMTPGRKFSTTTWASATRSRSASRPASDFRSRVAHRLLRPTTFQYADVPSRGSGSPRVRVESPTPGRSILRTSAPKSAR